MKKFSKIACFAALSLAASPTGAQLAPAIQVTGNVGLSVDAVGSNSLAVGDLSAFVPVGATIEQAFLYSVGLPFPFYSDSPTTLSDYNAAGITLGGVAITNFDTLVGATSSRLDIGAWYTARADVTSVIAALVAGSLTANFSFAVTEGTSNGRIDGELLAIAYSLPSLPTGTVIFLDGGQSTDGETTLVNFGAPLGDTTDAAFAAQLGLGISFSCCGQSSTVQINGTTLSDFAGNFDDGIGTDGGLITAGGIGDPALAFASSYAEDHELYNLAPYLSAGDTGFSIFTNNPTDDDNIFFASLYTTATARIGPAVPEPATWAMMLLGFGAMGLSLRRRRQARNILQAA